jgi:hypothetical protein
MAILIPLAVLVVVLGVYPNLLINPMRRDVKQITGAVEPTATPRHVVAEQKAQPEAGSALADRHHPANER